MLGNATYNLIDLRFCISACIGFMQTQINTVRAKVQSFSSFVNSFLTNDQEEGSVREKLMKSSIFDKNSPIDSDLIVIFLNFIIDLAQNQSYPGMN